MTPLGQLIAARIAATGPITVADYMADCLLHPVHGYYATHEPFGAAGDFITAPEISQMFGELVGLALAQAWLDQGAPDRIVLAELGPGRGTLMADVQRATAGVAGFAAAATVHLIEASTRLRQMQAKAVGRAVWHDTVATLPEAPLFLIANEFFDALPIRQFVRDGSDWRERMIGAEAGKLVFGLGPATAFGPLEHRLTDTTDGDLVELCPALPPIVAEIGRRIAQHGGAALIVDYGDWRSQGDTFQAVQGHEPADPLAAPGLADLTAHVDFEAIAMACSPASHTKLIPQGVFLERLGITVRAERLAARLTGPALDNHIAAHRRLTHAGQMGHLFKVMGLLPAHAPPLPGCAT
jgi:NADH dehydrogenase [ubiquinone] 1 alpha subcomplex assembly factor 7